MVNTLTTRLRDPLTATLAILAVLGWLAFLVVWIASSGAQRDAAARIGELEANAAQLTLRLQERDAASGTLESVQQEIARLQAQHDQLASERQLAEAERAALTAQVNDQAAALQARTTERQTAEAELARLRGELETATAALAETQQRTVQNSGELNDVGARLEAARAEEAAIRQTVAQLNEEASASANQVAELEGRLQAARELEAQAQTQVAEARAAQTQLDESRSALETAIADLEARRAGLSEEVASSEAQRGELQGQVVELTDALAARSAELAELERQIETAQAGTNAIAAASEAGLAPGRYIAAISGGRFLTASFSTDGAFTFSRSILPSIQNGLVTGRYRLEGDQLILSEATGSVGAAQFPMTCVISPTTGGFTVAEGGQNCMLAGLTLERL